MAKRFEVDGEVDQEGVRIDKKRQWKYAGNIRYNAGIPSAIYGVTSPIRWVGRKMRPTK